MYISFFTSAPSAFQLSSKSCLLCSLRVTFCELPSHHFLCQTHFPFMRDFGKGGLRDCLCWLLGQAQFSGPFFFSPETERHPPGGLASSSEKLLNSFSRSTKEASYQSLQMIPLSLFISVRIFWRCEALSVPVRCQSGAATLLKHLSGGKMVPWLCREVSWMHIWSVWGDG